jgi:hypothetical protein
MVVALNCILWQLGLHWLDGKLSNNKSQITNNKNLNLPGLRNQAGFLVIRKYAGFFSEFCILVSDFFICVVTG